MKSPLLSIVTVTFNAEKHLQHAVDSVRKCKINLDIQYIIVDGKSTDETLKIIERNLDVIDIYLSEPDLGIYDAMNKSIALCKGTWILFLGADDTLQDSFRDVNDFLTDQNAAYYGDYLKWGRRFGRKYSRYRLSKSNICQQSILYPKNALEKENFDLRYPIAADWDYNMRAWFEHKFKFEYIPVLYSEFGISGVSSTAEDKKFKVDQLRYILRTRDIPLIVRFIIKRIRTSFQSTRH